MCDTSTEAVKALLDGLVPGPWWHDNNEGFGANNVWATVAGDMLGKDIVAEVHGDSAEAEANARFIAASRELVPALLAERDAALAEVAQHRAGQTYRYIGKDGKPVLARDLEDELRDEVARLARQRAAQVLWDMLYMENGAHAGMTREDAQELWDKVSDEHGYAAVTAFLCALKSPRAALTAEPLGHGVTAEDFGGEA